MGMVFETDSILIKPIISIFYTFPYAVSKGVPLVNPSQRENFLTTVVHHINNLSTFHNQNWEAWIFPIWIPPSIRTRKKGVIFRKPLFSEKLTNIAKNIFSTPAFLQIGVSESAYYYDYGLGAVDILLQVEIK
jgi:hypothetical protein